ncbi:MAG: DUF1707 domain-containing protein [Candidatus Nanopelagicales bacterium]
MSDVVPGRPDPWQMRASDADREAYVAVLQTGYAEGRLSKDEYDERMGAAYAATTYAELAPLLHDLPAPATPLPGPPTVAPVRVSAPVGAESGSPLVALFSEVSRDSRWTLSEDQLALAAFGAVKLDLRQALLAGQRTQLRANAIFGSVEIVVGGDIDVEVTGVGVFGEYKRIDHRSTPSQGTGAPVVVISGLALFGSVHVTVVDPPVPASERVIGS